MRFAPLLAIVALVGVLSGLVGGLIALQLDEEAPAVSLTTATSTPQPQITEAERIRAAITKVSPAVVRIVTVVGADGGNREGTTSVGSGVIVDDRGLVLTNYHVIEGYEAIAVVLETGEERPAVLVADDSPFQDVALLSIAPGGLRVATLGTSEDLRIGDTVLAVAAGLIANTNQVKRGIVSDLELTIDRADVILEDVIQTDAAVNIGDSGGALVNLDGEVVGIVTANLRVTGEGEVIDGIGLAHAIDPIAPIIESVLRTGINGRPRYGIERIGEQHIPIDPSISESLQLPVDRGALLTGVAIGSPADDAGLLPGDIVLAVDGVEVGDRPLANLLKSGLDVELTLLRDGDLRTVRVLPAPLVQGP
jgi:S1-C subfamily serine protease